MHETFGHNFVELGDAWVLQNGDWRQRYTNDKHLDVLVRKKHICD